MKRFICLLLIATPCFGAETYLRRLGVNISLPERGGTFVDLVKEGYRWHVLASGAELVRASTRALSTTCGRSPNGVVKSTIPSATASI